MENLRKQMMKETREKVVIHEEINFEYRLKNTKVSIIVPVCNVEPFLEKCLESIIEQSLKEIEVICVNDGSKDNSLSILKEFARRDQRVKVIDKENAGYGHVMNLAMDAAVGEFIGIVESDDWVKPNMFETLYTIGHDKKIDIIKSDFYRFTEHDGYTRLYYHFLTQNEELYNTVLSPLEEGRLFKFTNTWTGIYKREFLENYCIRHQETPGASYQDNGFWFQTTSSADSIYYLNQPFYMNRRDNPNSSVFNKNKVYMVNKEYEFIYNYLKRVPGLYDRFKYIYTMKKYDTYFSNFYRIAEEHKKEFLETFSEELTAAYERGEVDENLFNNMHLKNMHMIVESPKEFYNINSKDSDNKYNLKSLNEGIIPILFISDEGYFVPTATAISSLIKNKKSQTVYDITVISIALSDSKIRMLSSLSCKNATINIVAMENNSLEDITDMELTNFGVPKTALLKFLIPNIMEHCEKLIYLDGDLIVKRDLTELFKIDIQNVYAGVVRDIPQVLYGKQAFGQKYGREYFNSGVLFLNLKRMRENKITEKLIQTKATLESKMMDQDVFNEVFGTEIKQLPIKYNTLFVNLVRSAGRYSLDTINKIYRTKYKSIESIRRDSAIIHFCSKDKPWKFFDVPMAEAWIEYYFRANLNDESIIRKSILDRETSLECNGVLKDALNQYSMNTRPVVFPYKVQYVNKIKNSIKTISQKINSYYVVYILFEESDDIEEFCATILEMKNVNIQFINLTKLLERDRGYANNKLLPDNYFKVVVPEVLSHHKKILLLDGIEYSDHLDHYFEMDLKEKILGITPVNVDKPNFWFSGILVYNVKQFILNITKFKYFDEYNKNLGSHEAIKKIVNRNNTLIIPEVGLCEKTNIYDSELAEIKEGIEKIIHVQKNQLTFKNRMETLEGINNRQQIYINQLLKELEMTRKSFSCRFGLALTYIPRKVKRFIGFIWKKCN